MSPNVTIRHRTRSLPHTFKTGGWSEVPTESVRVTFAHMITFATVSAEVTCFPNRKVKEYGLELTLERLQKKPI